METASAIWGVNCATTSFTILEASNEDEDNPNCPEDRDQHWVNKNQFSLFLKEKILIHNELTENQKSFFHYKILVNLEGLAREKMF